MREKPEKTLTDSATRLELAIVGYRTAFYMEFGPTQEFKADLNVLVPIARRANSKPVRPWLRRSPGQFCISSTVASSRFSES